MDDLAATISDAFAPAAPSGVSPRKWARLQSFLGALPPAAAAKLFAALERGRSDQGALPSAPMLSVLRTRLISEGANFPPRAADARRLFFTPFEDFFIAARRGRKRRARIDRASLGAIWSVLLEDPACADAAKAAGDLDAALARGEAETQGLEDALFAAAGEGLSRLVAHADEDAAYRADLGARLSPGAPQTGAAALHDLAEINLLIPAAARLRAVQAAFARPLAMLTPEDLFEARKIYAAAARETPQAAVYCLLAIAARMEAPWRALALYYHLMRAEDDSLPGARLDAAVIAESLFDDLEGLARGLERDADDDADIDDAAARLDHVAEFAGGMIAEAEREGDGAAVSRIEASRDIAASALSRFCEHALAAIRRNQPVRHAGGSSRLMALRPDIDRAVDGRAGRLAREGAAFLAKAERLGRLLDRSDAAAGYGDAALTETRRYAGDLIAEIRAAEGQERIAARKRMEATLRAAEILLPASEIALLKDRAAAAAVSA